MTISVDIEKHPRIKLKARRTLNGNIMIFDHEDIDIVLSTENNKCTVFPKEQMSDKAYDAQDRMLNYLVKRGIIDRSSIRGGNVYGSLEAMVLESKIPGVDQLQAALFSISEYISNEKPFFRNSSDIEDERLDSLLNPGPEDSTELGDVPQSDRKGSMNPGIAPYGFQYNYSLVREHKRKEEECS
tara:strand:- start:224 stop:778 length:555 start_codon:yes stop_codon:yes gene_type:complete